MILEQLAGLVDELTICADRTEIVGAIATRDRLDARIAVAVGDYQAADLYENDGDLTMAGWLRRHAGVAPTTAAREALRAKKLRSLPVLTDAFLTGRVTGGQVDLIIGSLPMRHLALFAEHEAEVVATFEPLTVEDTATAMRTWVAMADAIDPGPEPAEADTEVHLSSTIGGRGELHASLDPDDNAMAQKAFNLADPNDFGLTGSQRRAEAFRTILGFYLDHQQTRTGGRHRPHVNITMTYEQFVAGLGGTYTETGGPVTPDMAAMLACDAAVHRLILHGRSAILDYGRSVRTAPVDLFNALLARDQKCRWPGCDRPATHCDAHHVHWWERDGRTGIENLVLLCRRHHRRLHRQAWKASLEPDGTLHVTDSDGNVETTIPPGPIPQQFWRTGDGGPARRARVGGGTTPAASLQPGWPGVARALQGAVRTVRPRVSTGGPGLRTRRHARWRGQTSTVR